MTAVAQAGSRWEVTLAIFRTLTANLQKHADAESQKIAAKYAEITGTDYTGDAVLLRIPDIQSVQVKMDPQAQVIPTKCPAIYIEGGGNTGWESAASTTGRLAFANTGVQIAAYVTTSAFYQGIERELSELELILVAGGLGQAMVSALRTAEINGIWDQAAGITVATPEALDINGYNTTDDQETTAAKVLLSVLVGHECRY